MKKIINVLVITCLFTLTALAQAPAKKAALEGAGIDEVPGTVVTGKGIAMRGEQVNAGEWDVLNSVYRDNSVVLVGKKDSMSLSMTVSFDYAAEDGVPDSYFISNGTWSLVVFDNGAYFGTIYGDMPNGTVQERMGEESGTLVEQMIKAAFRIKGGLDGFAGLQEETEAKGSFGATINTEDSTTTSSLHGIL